MSRESWCCLPTSNCNVAYHLNSDAGVGIPGPKNPYTNPYKIIRTLYRCCLRGKNNDMIGGTEEKIDGIVRRSCPEIENDIIDMELLQIANEFHLLCIPGI